MTATHWVVPKIDMTVSPLPSQAPPRFQSLRVLFALVVRDMGSAFGRSAGGYLWAIAEPLGGILMLSLAFSITVHTPPMGTSFMLFYATGVVPYSMFNTMSKNVAGAISSNKGLLRYPVVTVLDAVFAKFVLNFLTVFVVAVMMFSGIILSTGVSVNINFGSALAAFVLASMLGLGIGTINCVLNGFFSTWRNIWSVLTRPLFLLSGIFYTFQSVPSGFQDILWYNPLVHIIGLMRAGFYSEYDPFYVSYTYVLGLSFGSFVIGAYLLRRHSSYLIEQ